MKLIEANQYGKPFVKNKVVMAPMTRSHASDDGIVSHLAALYDAQRTVQGS